MGAQERLLDELKRTVDITAEEVEGRFTDSLLAQLWMAAEVHSAAEQLVDDLLAQARRGGVTWEKLGLALGMSPQGARQRYVRRAALHNGTASNAL